MIQPHPDAPLGEVKHLPQYTPADFVPGSAILCRNTAPLVAFAYSLLQRDVPCKILGRDIGAQLAAIVKKMRACNLEDFFTKLSSWRLREHDRALADGKDGSAERINDQYQCLVFFMNSLDEDSRSVASLLAKIDLMFTDDSNGGSKTRVTLSTVHKAKGLEYPTVFILDKHKYMPSRYARLPWQKEQERNLLYVAVTRAMERLIYISSDNWKTEPTT